MVRATPKVASKISGGEIVFIGRSRSQSIRCMMPMYLQKICFFWIFQSSPAASWIILRTYRTYFKYDIGEREFPLFTRRESRPRQISIILSLQNHIQNPSRGDATKFKSLNRGKPPKFNQGPNGEIARTTLTIAGVIIVQNTRPCDHYRPLSAHSLPLDSSSRYLRGVRDDGACCVFCLARKSLFISQGEGRL